MRLLRDLEVIREELFGLRVEVATIHEAADKLLRTSGLDRSSDPAAEPEDPNAG